MISTVINSLTGAVLTQARFGAQPGCRWPCCVRRTNGKVQTLTMTAPLIRRTHNSTFVQTDSRLEGFRERLDSGPEFEAFLKKEVRDKKSQRYETSGFPASHSSLHKQPKRVSLPHWLKTPVPDGSSYKRIKRDLRGLRLHTVCEEARCPNMSDCWDGGRNATATATIMLMGDTCTRACRFCSVKTSRKPPPLDPSEPENTAEALSRWGLGYVVLTSVDRDDLPDGGAAHFAETVSKIKEKSPGMLIECLTGDFGGEKSLVALVAKSGLDVYAHNVETVEALTPFVRDRRATFRKSLEVLRAAKDVHPSVYTKTSLMLGLGESREQVLDTMWKLRESKVDIVTFGQYMRPTRRHMPVKEYINPSVFENFRRKALDMGFLYCASGPLVRSSYRAGDAFTENLIRQR